MIGRPKMVEPPCKMNRNWLHDIVSFLGYFAAPVADGSLEFAGVPVLLWALLPFLAVFGIAIYPAHQAVLMPTMGRLIHKRPATSAKVSVDELAFVRWRRRAPASGSEQRVAQSVVDQANAVTDSLHCSCWATLILSVLLFYFFVGATKIGGGESAQQL